MSTKVVGPKIGDQSSNSVHSQSSDLGKKFDYRRIYSALVFLPLFYLLTRYLPSIFFFLLILVSVLIALWEFYGLYFPDSHRQQGSAVGLVGGAILLLSLQWPDWLSLQTSLMVILTMLICYQVGLAPNRSQSLDSLPVLFFGILYVGLTLGHFLLLKRLPDGPFLIFFVLLVTWGGDAAAYYAGKCWGSRPLAPVLSPKKTYEGLAGGLFIAPVIAWLGKIWFLPTLNGLDCLILGLLLTCFGLAGDLSESAFKRQAGVKDSGGIVPGHGGILDRIDSLLLTVPTFYYYMVYLKGA